MTEPVLQDPTDPDSISTYFQTLRPVIHVIDATASHHDASENDDERIHHENPQNDHAALDPPPSHASLRAKFMEALGYEDRTQHNNSSTLPGVGSHSSSSSSLLHRAHVQTLPSLPTCRHHQSSRYPTGKDDAATLAPSGGWFTAIHIAHEGILNHHWMVKHATRLPSCMVVLATAVEDRTGLVEESALVERLTTTVDELRSNLAEKRGGAGIIHVVCLVSSSRSTAKSTATTAEARGEKILRQHRDATFRERVGTSCRLPSQQVHVLRGSDLERDEWEERVANSPYAAGVGGGGGILATNLPTNHNHEKTTIYMSPALRTVCTALLQCSTRYYVRLAEMAERKLATWRNRYHTTNASFEVNTLVCVVRCGRYAFKAGVFREMEHRCSSGSGGGAGAAAMRHYEESYRWIMELQRRIVRWRGGGGGGNAASSLSAAVASASSWSNNPPITPGAATTTQPTNEFSSPRFIESPGGGIGVELTLPTVTEMPLPPVSHGTPATTYRRSSSSGAGGGGSSTTPQYYYYSSLSLQCQAVASLLNYKLLQLPSTLLELELQWRRHRSAFLLQTVLADRSIAPTWNAPSPQPSWHRLQYCHNEMQTYATAAERIWRNDATLDPRSLSVEYHSAAAPWKIYGELAEVMLALGREVRGRLMRDAWKDPEEEVVSEGEEGRRRFVGSIVEGVGVGGWQWYFEIETKRNHRALALEYVMHALALLKENDSICQSISDNDPLESTVRVSNIKLTTPNAAVRLHYFAGRLLMSQDDPENALPHFRIAADKTKKWPSLHLTIERALLDCESKCSSRGGEIESSIKLLLDPSACAILSASEVTQAQSLAMSPSSHNKEVVWKEDDSGVTKPPFDFAVTFLESTHATSGDTVLACVSIKSCLDIPVCIESMQLNTTAGDFGIADLHRHANKATLRSWFKATPTLKGETENLSDISNVGPGVQLKSNGLAYFFTEVKLPSSLVDTAWGKTAADLTKFQPKNGKLCNVGFSVAAGNICKARCTDESNKIMLDGKPVAVTDLSEEIVSFFGGVPLVCHGLTLMLKPSSTTSASLLKLRIDRQRLLSPLGRTDALQYLMEECNYTAHSWSRPAHHPLHLGPRCLRILGPRPHMEVINLTDPVTGGDAIEGTVNRIVFQLQAGEGYDCWDVSLRLRCSGRCEKITPSLVDVASEGEVDEAEQDNQSLFVQMSLDAGTNVSTEEGIALPQGWEPRSDVIIDESNDVSTRVSSHLKAGKCMLLPLDLFRPLTTSSDNESDSTAISTSYEVILTFREVRVEDGDDDSAQSGNQVMVVQRGIVNWIKPFSADFAIVDEQKSFPGGVKHASNMTNFVPSPSSRMDEEPDIISADGERVRMRFVLKAKGLGPNLAASVQSVVNEVENDAKQKVLYSSSESATFLPHAKRGSKLCMSYTVITQRNTSHSNEHVTMPLGVVSVNWKPVGLALSSHLIQMFSTTDEYVTAHGPLCLPDIAPMIFYGPQCQVLNAPFTAKILKCPTPKVGIPFRVTYQIRNKTAKSQTLSFSLNNAGGNDDATFASSEHLMITGKVKGQVQVSPFEEKSFPFTFMSMIAGKVRCPSFCVSSGRHQSWVINESVVKERYLFIMP